MLSVGCGSHTHLIPGSNPEGERWEHFTLSFSLNRLSSTCKHLPFSLFLHFPPSFLLIVICTTSSVSFSLCFIVVYLFIPIGLCPSYPHLLFFHPLLPLPYPIFFNVWVCPRNSTGFPRFSSSSTLFPPPPLAFS